MKTGNRQQAVGEWRRAKILCLVLYALLLAPCFPAQAQQAGKIPRIGYLEPGYLGPRTEFQRELQALGYVEGENIIIEWRSWEGQPDRELEAVAELTRLKLDVIIVAGSWRAVRRLQSLVTAMPPPAVPIVALVSGDPVRSGLVSGLAGPTAQITGLTFLPPELHGKTLELLMEIIPKLSRIAVLRQTGSDPTPLKEMVLASRALGLQPQFLQMREPTEFDGIFQAAITSRAEALYVEETAMLIFHRKRIMDFSEINRIPAVGQFRQSADAGYLMTYGSDISDVLRRAAFYVDNILKGAKAADLPIERPAKFEFVINLKTANRIGLTIPPNVLARADRVIQ